MTRRASRGTESRPLMEFGRLVAYSELHVGPHLLELVRWTLSASLYQLRMGYSAARLDNADDVVYGLSETHPGLRFVAPCDQARLVRAHLAFHHHRRTEEIG